MKNFYTYLLISGIFWGIATYALVSELEHTKKFCNRTESESGLAAECFAPAAVIYTAIFAVLFVLDLSRIWLMHSTSRKTKVRQ